MKVSFVSSQAISQAMRYQSMRVQVELTKATTEATTGRVADVGLALGARAGFSASMTREVARLDGLIDSNEIANSRLAATQLSLQQLTESAQKLVSDFATAISGSLDKEITRQQAQAVLGNITAALNGNLNGEFIFAGINTDVKPIADFNDPASANRQAFDDAFLAHFTFAQDDPQAADITADEMTTFLTTVVEPQFDADWSNWSSATNQQIMSRISLSETTSTSVSANVEGVRKLTMAAASVARLLEAPLNDQAMSALLEHAIGALGTAVVDLGNQQAYAGLSQQRLTGASERMSMQMDIFKLSIADIEGVDHYEAITRVNALEAQLQMSYSLTARMQNLSLVKYI